MANTVYYVGGDTVLPDAQTMTGSGEGGTFEAGGTGSLLNVIDSHPRRFRLPSSISKNPQM